MDPYNSVQVQAVWQRVMEKNDPDALRRSLLEMMAAEHASARGYERMAKQTGTHAQLLRRMGQEERQHAHKLFVLYDLLYGRNPEVASGLAERPCDFREAVRRAFRGELMAAESYRQAAQRWSQHRQLFEALAADEQRHSKNLHHIARQLSRT